MVSKAIDAMPCRCFPKEKSDVTENVSCDKEGLTRARLTDTVPGSLDPSMLEILYVQLR
jgi:hypothetical protein